MSLSYKPNKKEFNVDSLISKDHIEKMRKIQKELPSFMNNALSHKTFIINVMQEFSFNTVLDYGCGDRSLKNIVETNIDEIYLNTHEFQQRIYRGYDPAMDESCDITNKSYSHIVLCIDVLQYVEKECIDSVLDDIRDLTDIAALFVIKIDPYFKLMDTGAKTFSKQEADKLKSISYFPYCDENDIIFKISSRFKIHNLFNTSNGHIVVLGIKNHA